MKKEGKDIISQFDDRIDLLESFRQSSERLIMFLLKNANINPHQITSRIKDKKSIENKIVKKNYKYNSLEEITDIVGVRIVAYFEDEINIIAKVIEDEFDIDSENSVDKRVIAIDKFGYRSLHYVVSFKSERINLPEYSNFHNLKLEFQIRSILQHSWAEIEHDLGYKGEHEIPDSVKRTFYRVAALLEQADIEFVKLKNEIQNYKSIIDAKVKEAPDTVAIDKASLISFLTNSTIVKEIEYEVIAGLNINILPSEGMESLANEFLINDLKNKGINSIGDLEEIYKKHRTELIDSYNKFLTDHEILGFELGSSILWIRRYD